jgi:hypothetical protein
MSKQATARGTASPARIQRRFRILDVHVTLDGPLELIEPVSYAYRRFEVDRFEGAADAEVTLRLTDPETLQLDDLAIPIVPGLDLAAQFDHHLQTALMDAVGSCVVLHAAALTDGAGRGVILAGPSAHGKSSLALELARRGHGFLSDDLAPFEIERATILPYPRAVAVRPGEGAPIPEPFLSESHKASRVHRFEKTLLDVGEVLGEQALVDRPVPLGHVFLLATGGRPRSHSEVDLAARLKDADELDGLFLATDGVEVLERREGPSLRAWRLALDHGKAPTQALAEILDGERVVLSSTRWERQPDFTSAAEAVPVTRREAAERLAREVLNRRSGGRLLAGYGGSLARLFVDLAGALSQARCWRIRVGACAETADLIERLIAEEGRR